jgi:hypothetical protein
MFECFDESTTQPHVASAAWLVVTSRHGQQCLGSTITPRPSRSGSTALAWLNRDIASRASHLGIAWHDSTSTSCRGQVASAAPSPAWLRGLLFTSPTSNLTRRFITDQTRGLEEYHFNRQPDLSSLLPTSLTSTWPERIITIRLWDTSPNQLSHFLSCIFLSYF